VKTIVVPRDILETWWCECLLSSKIGCTLGRPRGIHNTPACMAHCARVWKWCESGRFFDRGKVETMSGRATKGGKATILESTPALILMGILAGATGGLVIGLVTGAHSSSSSAPSTAQPVQR
jgi:hypothetical protein